MAWWNRNQGLESNRPFGIDTPMNYQDQIRSLPGGNYQGWTDRIMDPDLMVNQEYEQSLQDINTNPLYDDQGTGQAEINYEDAPVGFSKFFTGDRRLHPNNPLLKLKSPITGIMNAVKDQFKYRGATEEAWDSRTGTYLSPEEQDQQNALGGYYSNAARDARRNRARVVKMLARQAEGKSFSEKNLKRLQDLGYGEKIITDTVTDVIPHDTGGVTRDASGWSSPGYTTRGGFTEPSRTTGTQHGGAGTRDVRGHHGNWAEGGRIGYANGEFVDEDINIQGPGFDVNENIEMTSGGEGDILEQLVAKYIQAGFPPDQAQEMAMQELQQMVAQSGQGEGIASLV